MTLSNPAPHFDAEYDARLVEEAVLLRVPGHPEEGRFRRARNRIYELADSEEREKRFQELHAEWFQRLHLDRPITAAFEEQPSLAQHTRGCYVLSASSSQEEGADLREAKDPPPPGRGPDRLILLKLKPNSFLDSSTLHTMLRHEFLHIADMLDPRFGYEPRLPNSAVGPAHENLLRERYRVLWDTWIDGRLLRRGWAAEGVREKRFAEFAVTFSMGEREAEEKFREFFDSDSLTHAALVAFALNPGSQTDRAGQGRPRAQPCPLCRFPSFHLEDGAGLPASLMEEVAADCPGWRPEQGLCGQCAELYRARGLSRSAEAMLPRI